MQKNSHEKFLAFSGFFSQNTSERYRERVEKSETVIVRFAKGVYYHKI